MSEAALFLHLDRAEVLFPVFGKETVELLISAGMEIFEVSMGVGQMFTDGSGSYGQ